jgi:hypothetical protein
LKIINAHASTLVTLTKALAEVTATITALTTTNATLVAEPAKSVDARTNRALPSLSSKNDTGHTLNTSGVLCPKHRGVRNEKKQKESVICYNSGLCQIWEEDFPPVAEMP